MPKPSSFDNGKKIPKEEYKKKLDNYYQSKSYAYLAKNAYDKILICKLRHTAKANFIWPSKEAKAWVVKEYYRLGGTLIGDKKNDDDHLIANLFNKSKRQANAPKLFAQVKAEAKRKFKVYPSVYAKAWIVKEYKKRGGTFAGQNLDTRNYNKKPGELFFNTKDNSLSITTPSGQTVAFDSSIDLDSPKQETNERKIVERRGDAKEGDLWVHPNTGNLHMKVGDRWVTVNDPNELPKINNQKRRKDLSDAFAEKRKKEKTEIKEVVLETKPKITRGQFLYKYKSPQNFYSWQDLAREHINCKHRSQQYIYDSPAYYLKDDLCNSLINTNIDNLQLTESPNVVNPSFFLLHSNKINEIKYSFIECHTWGKKDAKDMLIHPKFKFDVYVNFVIEPNKIYYYAFNWKNLKIFKILQFTEVEDHIIQDHFKTVVNLLLLMNQQPDIITEEYIPSKIVPLQKKYKVQSDIKPRAICWVGKDFTTRVVKLKPKQDEDFLVVSGSKRKLRPHWRRGHWHTVLKGAKRKERKMRWYQPVFVLGNAA
jgi:hypothetical protein|tara:strand:+ start:47 stop:1660 length:1614 start_codon:yes stop_codon:yes gene_type:complete